MSFPTLPQSTVFTSAAKHKKNNASGQQTLRRVFYKLPGEKSIAADVCKRPLAR
jgi:hypothetical protein